MQYDYQEQEDAHIASLSGQFTFSDHEPFRALVEKLTANDTGNVVLDLEKLDYIDSAALGMLLIANDECEQADKKLTLRKPTGHIRKIFTVSNFDQIFTIQYD